MQQFLRPDQVTLFGRSISPLSLAAKHIFDLHSIPYREINMQVEEEGWKEVWKGLHGLTGSKELP